MSKVKSSKKDKIQSNLLSKTVIFLQQNSLPAVLSIILFCLLVFLYSVFITDKFYPLTYIGSVNISFLTQGQAIRIVESSLQQRSAQKLNFVYQDRSFTVDLASSSARIDYSPLDQSLAKQQAGLLWDKILRQFSSLFYPQQILLKVNLSLASQLDQIAKTVDKPATNAQLLFDETPSKDSTSSSRIQIKEGKDGLALDRLAMEKAAANYLLFGKYQSLLPTTVVPPKITTDYVQKAKTALEATQKESIRLKFQGDIWILDTKQLIALLDLTSGSNLLLDKDKTYSYLKKIAFEINQDVQEGQFEFNPQTKRVTAFKSSQEGKKLDIDKTYSLLTEAFTLGTNKTILLPVTLIKPKIQTSDVNSLGIKELVGRGTSYFAGSIPNRIYNIQLTASKINGVLVPPGEVFSFNQTVGDITAETGFKQAYVIKEGRTVLDDGGGVCQDSTTLFRAVLNAGLPVIKRTAHAYRVGYYEQGFPPGLDATVFYPSVDFQFKNDTPAHILIQAYTVGTTLYVDLYGTSDGRMTSISRSIVTDQISPPPDLRQDDPTLPRGTVKQVDWSAWGAKVSFVRTVTRGGEVIIKETWNSTYRPWQAVYLVGTKEN